MRTKYSGPIAAAKGLVAVILTGFLTPEIMAADIPFTRVLIDGSGEVKNPHCKAVGDIDGDGFIDIVIGGGDTEVAPPSNLLVWYRYPNWQRSVIQAGDLYTTDMQLGDVDGDGDLDAIVSRYGGTNGKPHRIVWYENPRPTGNPGSDPWSEHIIGSASAHDVELGDIDRDGRLDVVTRVKGAGDTSVWFQNNPDSWTEKVINTVDGEGTALGDIDDDGDLDVAHNGFWLESPANPRTAAWLPHTIASWPTDVGVRIADINGDGRKDVLLSPAESPSGRFSWYEASDPKNGPWTEHVIDNTVSYLHGFRAVDMDSDGDLDLVAAEMHQSSDPDEVSVYFNQNGTGLVWTQQVVAISGAHNLRVADIGNDGDIDIVGANWSSLAPNGAPIEMWENQSANTVLPLDRWTRHVIDSQKPWGTIFITSGDVNRDGLIDVVTGGWWYRNPGSAGGTWTRNTIGSPLNNIAALYDFDGDADLDVLGTQGQGSASDARFVWAQNDGSGGFTIRNNVSTGQGDFLQGVAVGRFSSGGPLEVALSWHAGGQGVQMLTVPSSPAVNTWSWRSISSQSQDEQLSAGDIDRDGDLDLLQGTQWLRNDGGSWSGQTLSSAAGYPDRNRLIDINRDGRLDSLVGFEGVSSSAKLAWYEQPVSVGGSWTEHLIANLIGPMSVDAADMDRDGDVDVVVGEHNLSNPGSARLLVYENLDGVGGSWRMHTVYTGDEHHDGAQLVDIDGDGDLDIISIGWENPRVLIYENTALQGDTSQVAAPTISPNGGSFSDSVTVTLQTATAGAEIRYTLDGSTPSFDSPLYTVPFELTNSAIVRACARKNGMTESAVASATFTISSTQPGSVPTTELALWLRADAGISANGSTVWQWQDQSGNGTHANQSAAGCQPTLIANALNGMPVVQFDGLNDFMTFGLSVNGLGGMTIFLVSANSADRTGGGSEAGDAALFWNENQIWATVYLSPFQNRVQFRFGTTQNGNQPTYTRPVSMGSDYSLTVSVKNGTTDSLYVNSTRVVQESGKLPAIAGCQNIGNLGRGYNNNTYFPGTIAEVMVYRRALTDSERLQVEQYLDSKYGLTGPVAPWITTQPANVHVDEPAPAGFNVVASGTEPLSYRWQRDGVTISGANGSIYTLDPTSAAADNSAQFSVVVSNSVGSVTSMVATLTVDPKIAPSIATHPSDVTVEEPAAASFSVAADGSTPLFYQWQRDGANIAGATNSIYVLTPSSAASDNGAQFSVVVSNSAGSIISTVAILTVNAMPPQPPTITTQPANVTVTEPGAASFNVAAAGTTPLAYQWRRNGVDISGASSSTYVLTPTSETADNGAQFSVVVTNTAGTVTSVIATLTVNAAAAVPTNDLALWFRADAGVTVNGGTVTQWQDQSGNGVHASQSVSGSRPSLIASAVNGKPAIQFDGLNDFMTFNLAVNGLSGMTLCLVAANSSDRTGGGSEAGDAALFWNENQIWATVYLSPFQSRVQFRFGTTQTGNQPTFNRPASIGSAYTLNMSIKNGATDSLYVNGTRVVHETGKLTTITGCQNIGNLGRGYNNNTYFPGTIAEVLVYRRAVTDSERQTLEGYLQNKYGLSPGASPLALANARPIIRIERLADGRIRGQVAGEAQRNYEIQESTNLMDWFHFITLRTAMDGTYDFFLTNPPLHAPHFFRVRSQF